MTFNLTDLNASPVSARERYSSPIPTASRRQLFTGKRLPKSPGASPLKMPLPIAPKPPQGKVRVTRLNPLQNNAAGMASALMTLIQHTSPQKSADHSLLPALQAILSKSPSSNKKGGLGNNLGGGGGGGKDEGEKPANGQDNIPKITVSETLPPPSMSPPTSVPAQSKRTGSVALFYRKVSPLLIVIPSL